VEVKQGLKILFDGNDSGALKQKRFGQYARTRTNFNNARVGTRSNSLHDLGYNVAIDQKIL
jgi:hypothetical protein